MHFAKNLRFLRRYAKGGELSQSELGDKISVDYNTISRWEQGKSEPKLEALAKLAIIFNVSIEELRNVDLTHSAAAEPAPKYGVKPSPLAAPSKPAKHTMLVTVELDGTAASLGRIFARLSVFNDTVADTDDM